MEVDIRNIGGIEKTNVSFQPGVTLLVGRNATNRTSFLTAIMAVAGSDKVSVKGDAEMGRVELRFREERYFRELNRTGTTVSTDGNPYLDDPALAELFAFLLEDNEARRAVAQGNDLREIIMRPIDTNEIQRQIDRLNDRRDEVESRIEKINELKNDLPSLENEKQHLQEQIDKKRSDLEEKETELRSIDIDVEESQRQKGKLNDKFEKLQEKRNRLNDIRFDLETEQNSIAELESELRELKNERSELSDVSGEKIEEIESKLDYYRSQKQQLEREVSELQSIHQFNSEMLEDFEGNQELTFDEENSEQDSVTDRLLADDTVRCWTCGSQVNAEQIEGTIEKLQELNQSKLQEIDEIETEIDELKERERELSQRKQQREQIESQIQRNKENINSISSEIDELKSIKQEEIERIEEIEGEIDRLESNERSEVMKLHKEANNLEYNLGQLENKRENIVDNISDIEDKIQLIDELEIELGNIREEIEKYRTKTERIEKSAIDEFNHYMDSVLDILEYDNLERIWLERVEKKTRKGRRKVPKSVFEMHVVRKTRSGTSYEDTIDHLSESEREVTGLVFALAGYFTHDVHESVPFILLDSLESIDAQRIAKLIDFLKKDSQYLLVALLPEDADHLDRSYERITEI